MSHKDFVDMDLLQYKAAFYATSREGVCSVSVDKEKFVDINRVEMNLHQAVYTVGPIALKCMVKEHSQTEPVTFYSYCILKNFRHKNAVSVEKFYFNKHGQGRFVVSWVDQTLRGWLVKTSKGTQSQAFDHTYHHSQPSSNFRNMIIGMCAAVDSMFRSEVYPKSISLDDMYLVKSNTCLTIKILVSEVVDLSYQDGQTKFFHEEKIWNQLGDVIDQCCNIAVKKRIHPDSERFFSYVRLGIYRNLKNYPDLWNDEQKKSYLFSIMAWPKSYVQREVNAIKDFAWPVEDNGNLPFVIRGFKAHQERTTKAKYNTQRLYDYLRLCRNVIKHWASLPPYLKVNCNDVSAFLRKMEKWSPRIWCCLYEALEA